METFEIESAKPIPGRTSMLMKKVRFTMQHLESGQSFHIPTVAMQENTDDVQRNLHYHARKEGIRVKTHKTDSGLRVWRVDGIEPLEVDLDD